MEYKNNEYNATSVNANSCYSNMTTYGSNGKIRIIQPPTPSTSVPTLFLGMKEKPHNYQYSFKNLEIKKRNCNGYYKFENLC